MKGIFSSTPQSHPWPLIRSPGEYCPAWSLLILFSYTLAQNPRERSKGPEASGDNRQHVCPCLGKTPSAFTGFKEGTWEAQDLGICGTLYGQSQKLMINEKRLFKLNKCKWGKKPPVREVILASGYINVFILLFPILVCCSSMKADLFEMLLLETP